MRSLEEINAMTDGELHLAIEAMTIGVANLQRIATDTSNKIRALTREQLELQRRTEQVNKDRLEYESREDGDRTNLANAKEELEVLLDVANERKLV